MTPSLDELTSALAERRCLLAAGSGVPASFGAAPWRQLVESLLIDGRRARAELDWAPLEDLLRDGEYADLAEVLFDRLGEERILAAGWRWAADVGVESSLGSQLQMLPFAGAISSSWDDCVERVFADRAPISLSPGSAGKLTQALYSEQAFVLHPWGRLTAGDALFTAQQLRAAIQRDPTFARVLSQLFLTHCWLFVGFSPEGVDELISNALPGVAPGQRHFLIVPTRELNVLSRERLAQRNVIPIEVETVDDVPALLASLVVAQITVPAATPGDRSLRSAVLHNLGPFEHVEVALHANWTVVLGDNATGKSTILRGIALALCGDDEGVKRLAPSLLRAGAEDGYVEVRIGDDLLRTDLLRQAGQLLVRARGSSPVQSGVLLAIAFPPVRGVSTRDPQGVAAFGDARPNVGDLLPLIAGPVDPRLDDLKQWIFNEVEGGDAEATLGALFDAMGQVSPMKYAFDGIGPSGEILVATADGTFAVDLLSQGMISVLGWVGTLVRRLCEISGGADIRTQHAVVLIDEIDAHLHPGWQRQIVGLLRVWFSEIQFVVSTHSPLVVGSAEVAELVVLRRDQGPPRIELLANQFEAWRADQILTSEAFDLTSSRSPEAEADLERLRSLSGRDDLSPTEAEELSRLQNRLRAILPPAFEGVTIGDVGTMAAVLERLQVQPEEARQHLMEELRRRLGTSDH